MSVTEPSDAINAGMAIQTEGSRLALRASRRPQLDLWLVGWLDGRVIVYWAVVWSLFENV